MSLAKKPRPTPRALLKEFYGKADTRIRLTDDEKRDWRAAMNLMKEAGIKTTLETAVRHNADLAKIVGHASLLTDVARKYAESRGKTGKPVKLAALRDAYLEALKKRARSVRHIESQRSQIGQL